MMPAMRANNWQLGALSHMLMLHMARKSEKKIYMNTRWQGKKNKDSKHERQRYNLNAADVAHGEKKSEKM